MQFSRMHTHSSHCKSIMTLYVGRLKRLSNCGRSTTASDSVTLTSPIYSNVCTTKHFCSDSESFNSRPSIQDFKEQLIKKHFFPTEEEAEKLHSKFPDPKKVVDDLFAPFLKTEQRHVPKLEVKKQMRDSICKTRLLFSWPAQTDVCGVHKDEDTSVHNAYLTACKLLLHMGLLEISDSGTRAYPVEQVIRILEDLASKQSYIGYDANNFRVINLLQYNKDDAVTWNSSLQVFWPVSFIVNSNSTCLDLAYYQSCLKALMKFKAFGYLDCNNQLKTGILLAMQKYDILQEHFKVRDLSNPDFELFVDASNKGMGAYLISIDDEKIRWLSDRWVPNRIRFDPKYNSNFSEFYALVTAVFTWKHKFVGKKVLCYCDNESVINSINHGIYSTKLSKKPRSIDSLYVLLMKVCHTHNITVVGVHVPRLQNMAADLLSRCDVDSFKKIFPTAYENPKKSKKLWFCTFNKDVNPDKDEKDDSDPKQPS